MKTHLLVSSICAALLCGCKPQPVQYDHVVVEEKSNVKVMERSTESNDSQGKPLSAGRIGLPTKCVVTGAGYKVTICTPLNPAPVAFLKVNADNGKTLELRGAHVHQIEHDSGMGIEGYKYSFMFDKTAGGPMEFDVVTGNGAVLGHEKIDYEIISRGHAWVIDSL